MVKRTKNLFLVSLMLAVLVASIPFMALGQEGKRCPLGTCYGGCTCYGEVESQGPCCFECEGEVGRVVCCDDYYESGAYYDVCFVDPF